MNRALALFPEENKWVALAPDGEHLLITKKTTVTPKSGIESPCKSKETTTNLVFPQLADSTSTAKVRLSEAKAVYQKVIDRFFS